MIIQIGTEVDESRILWKHKEADEWTRADIDDLIRAYESMIPCGECIHWNADTKGCKRNPSVEAWNAEDRCSYGDRGGEA